MNHSERMNLGLKLDLHQLLARLAEDPRLPGFQTITLFPSGAAQLIHRHGAVPFRNLDDLAQWLENPHTDNAS